MLFAACGAVSVVTGPGGPAVIALCVLAIIAFVTAIINFLVTTFGYADEIADLEVKNDEMDELLAQLQDESGD